MKFRLKITLCMLCVMSLLFGVGGGALLSISANTALRREKESARESYQMLLNILQVVNRIDTWKDSNDISAVLSELLTQNAASWYALRLSSAEGAIFETGSSDKIGEVDREDISPEYCTMISFSDPDGGNYIQITGAFVMGEETLSLDAAQDITSIYEMRRQQEDGYRLIFLCMAAVCAVLTFTISWLLTRPLTKLSKAAKQIGAGNLDCRSDIKSSDEIGQLSSEFDKMASRLEANVTELRDAVVRQERFMGSFTHELKTPMVSIIGYSDLMRGGMLTPEEQAEAANYIFQEVRRLENLSIKLLDIFVAGKEDIILRPASPASLVERALESQRVRLEEKKISVRKSLEDGTCLLEPDLILTVLSNLIDNAQKALESGGKLHIQNEMTPDGCRLYVADNGKGIPEEALEHITEAFYRVDKSRSRAQGGAGLGLSLCAKIVELHGGSMRFSSRNNLGTLVIVELKGGRS